MSEDTEVFDLIEDAVDRAQYAAWPDQATAAVVAEAVLHELVRKALDESAESVIRWLDPGSTYQDRIEGKTSIANDRSKP